MSTQQQKKWDDKLTIIIDGRSKNIVYFSILVLLLFLAFTFLVPSCAPRLITPHRYLAPDYAQRQPRVIAVLPIEIAEGLGKLKESEVEREITNGISDALKKRGYEVVSPEQITKRLQDAGIKGYAIYETIYEKPTNLLCQLLAVDAVLKAFLINYKNEFRCPPVKYFYFPSPVGAMPVLAGPEDCVGTIQLEMKVSLLEKVKGETLWDNIIAGKHGYQGSPSPPPFLKDWIKSGFRTLPKTK